VQRVTSAMPNVAPTAATAVGATFCLGRLLGLPAGRNGCGARAERAAASSRGTSTGSRSWGVSAGGVGISRVDGAGRGVPARGDTGFFGIPHGGRRARGRANGAQSARKVCGGKGAGNDGADNKEKHEVQPRQRYERGPGVMEKSQSAQAADGPKQGNAEQHREGRKKGSVGRGFETSTGGTKKWQHPLIMRCSRPSMLQV
jgi:hypothetical protein